MSWEGSKAAHWCRTAAHAALARVLRWVANSPHISLTFTRADRYRLDAIRGTACRRGSHSGDRSIVSVMQSGSKASISASRLWLPAHRPILTRLGGGGSFFPFVFSAPPRS